ncbi:MAG: hypothetical protein AAF569_04200 [Pseudomonadota bacterium]
MLVTMLIMALAVNGGLYAGTIVFSAYKTAELNKASSFFQKITA